MSTTTLIRTTSTPAVIVVRAVKAAENGRTIQVIAAARRTETKERQTNMAVVLDNNRPAVQEIAAVSEVPVGLAELAV